MIECGTHTGKPGPGNTTVMGVSKVRHCNVDHLYHDMRSLLVQSYHADPGVAGVWHIRGACDCSGLRARHDALLHRRHGLPQPL